MYPEVFAANSPEELNRKMKLFIDSDQVRIVHNIQYVMPVYDHSTNKMVYSAMVTYGD